MNVSAIIKRHWLPLIGLNSAIISSTVAISILSPKTWTAGTQLILPDTTTNLDASLGTLGQLKEQGITFTNELSPLQVQTSIITSNDVISAVWSSDPEKNKYSSLESYKKLFKVKAVDQSTTIDVKVTGSRPELAKQRSQKLIESYQSRVNALRQGAASSREKFSQRQLHEAERNLQLAKNQLARYKQSTGLVNSEEQTKNLVAAINSTRTSQTQAAAQAQAAAIRSQVLAQRVGMTPNQAINSLRLSENKEYQALRQKLSEIDTEIAVQKGNLTDEHPTIKSLQQKRQEVVVALNQQLRSVVPNGEAVDNTFGGNNFKDTTMDLIADLIQAEAESNGLQQQSIKLQQQVDKLQRELSTISTQQGKLLDLQRKYDIAEGLYKGIVAQLEQGKITAFNTYPNVQVLDEPSVELKPSSPKRSLIFLGGILTSILGSAAVISFLESRNPLLKPKDLQEIELPVLGRISTFKSSTDRLDTEAPGEIEFQRLASTISLMQLKNRRLMVTSSTPGEGKTLVSLGLAKALVVLGFRVLIVDGDFQRAKMSQHFGYFLPQEANTLPVPVPISTRLDLLPAALIPDGKVVEFVARGEFERHLNGIQTTKEYDYIIVDSAPIAATSETALMAKAMANVLLVIRLGVSDRYMVEETLEQLMRHNAQIIGLALNGVEQRGEGYIYKRDHTHVNS